MANFKKFRKSTVIVLGSGVECEIQSLLGVHQKWITNQDENKRLQGFIDLMVDCIKRIGSDTDITEEKVEKMLGPDRKQLLVAIRQLSTNHEPNFVFDYEFPAKTGQKKKQRYDILFDENDFPMIPFKWVRDEMCRLYAEQNEINDRELVADEVSEALKMDVPVMYETYDEMLIANREQSYKLPESGVVVDWKLADGETESAFGKRLKSSGAVSSHTQLQMATPTYVDTEETEGKKTPISLPLDQLTYMDIEGLRKNINDVEGKYDTLLAIQYKDENIHAQIDLVTVSAFFFPSLAI